MIQPPSLETKYFRSFTSIGFPLKPLDELDLDAARSLKTYYEATYDGHKRLKKFQKHLRQSSETLESWTTAFVELYEYWEDGSVKLRTVQAPGQADREWEFAKQQRQWSDYFVELCERWFGGAEQNANEDFAKQALLFHEQLTELELEVFPIVFPSTDALGQVAITELISGFREILTQAVGGHKLSISVVGQGECEPEWLRGFDDPPLSLLGVVDEVRRQDGTLAAGTIVPRLDFDESGRRWASDMQIGAISTAPVIIEDGGRAVEAFSLFVLVKPELRENEIVVVNSLCRRFALTVQHTISYGLRDDVLRKNTDAL